MTDQEKTASHDRLPLLLENIRGSNIESRLIALARIGGTKIEGTPELPERYSVNRLALSPEDLAARKLLRKQMIQLGMQTEQHPLGLIGIYQGTQSELPPVIMMSHTDSVPNAGMYDGTVGVVSAIEIIRQFKEMGLSFPRSILVLSLTGEESAGFGKALFGSSGIFRGLSDVDLAKRRSPNQNIIYPSIGEALDQAGFDQSVVKKARINKRDIYALVELHVEQGTRLEEGNLDVAVVDSIVAPERWKITIGDKLEPGRETHGYSKYYDFKIEGKAGHSGTTPMGKEFRADGFVLSSEIILHAKTIQKQIYDETGKTLQISVGGINIEGQSMNKIPGNTNVLIRIAGDDEEAILRAEKMYRDFINLRNISYKGSAFKDNPISISEIKSTDMKTPFYQTQESIKAHFLGARIVELVNSVCTKFKEKGIVGTVGEYSLKDGRPTLSIDVRGSNLAVRNEVVQRINSLLERFLVPHEDVIVEYQLVENDAPGSMNSQLTQLAREAIKSNNIGRFNEEPLVSKAGHDSLNSARAGIPTVMFFVPSRKNGISHNPEEYSASEDLEKGARAMAALVYSLASSTNNDL